MLEATDELLAFLKDEETRSRNEALQARAETNLASYKGELYGDEEEGRSKAVSRDVAEVIDHMEVAVLRAFVSGDRVVEFEPLTDQDEQAADDATEVMRRDFQRKGYKLLHDWFKEGNINVLGIVKACVETRRVERTDPDTLEDKAGEEYHFYDRLVPLEEFRYSPDATSTEDACYLAHATYRSVSELVEMGFDRDEVEAAHDYTQVDTALAQQRSDPNFYFRYGEDRQGALRQVVLMEEYVRFDLDDDGIAERLCVHRVGDTVLRVEEVDYQPFVVYCPFPMPGRIDGESLAEKVNDIQRINTVLMRLGFDGLYSNLSPGYLVNDDSINEHTYDDILTVRPNRIVRWRGAVAPQMETKQDVSATAFQAIEFMIGQRESRTGITRLNQGLDADALNKTATGTALMQAQGQQMEEYLARNFAEALAELMALKHMLYRRYSPPISLRVDGEFRQIDPSGWPEAVDTIIRVGLGTGNRDKRVQARMMLLQVQREVMMGGLPIVQPEQLYKAIAGLVRDVSLGNPNDYVVDPSTIPPQPPQPNADEMKLQGEMQLAQAKLALQQQEMQAKYALQAQEMQAKAELEQQKAEVQAMLDQRKLEAELAIADIRAQAEIQAAQLKAEGVAADTEAARLMAQLALDKAELEANLAHRKAVHEAALKQDKAQLDGVVAASQQNLAEEKAAFEARTALEKQQFEEDLALREANLRDNVAARDAQRKDHIAIHKNRPGGQLDE